MTEDIHIIQKNLTTADALGQLAEEAAELAQAALKLQRLLHGVNPPRKTFSECWADVFEELADVFVCLRVLGFPAEYIADDPDVKGTMRSKAARWAGCLCHGKF